FQSTVATVLAQVVAVVLALVGFGPWALVAQLVVTQGIAGVLAWVGARWRPSWEFSPRIMGTMARFGSQVVAVDLMSTTRIMLEAAIITNTLGAAALGYLSIAQRLVQVAQDVGAAAMVPVSTVVFAKVKDSITRLRAGYVRALRIGYAAVAPLLTFVAVDAPAIIPLVFGDGWEPSIPVTQALSIAAILILGAMIDTGLHYGIGAPGRWFLYQLTVDVLMVGTTFVLARHGLVGVAVGSMGMAMIATMIRWVLVGRLIDYPVRSMAGGFVVSMIPVMVSGLGGLGVRELTSELPGLVGLGLVGLTVALLHVLTLRVVSRRVLADVLGLLPLPKPLAPIRKLA
ncbi:MAG: oligosaccharide flippase family protein, partial [Microlunatus sp.]|nr:oligosaccharide flippase family protein [Microlunatus sp.]